MYNKQIYIEYREHKVEYIIIDLLDILSHLYDDRPARSTVFIILQQTSCIYCLHFTLAIVVGLPPQQPQIGYFMWGWGGLSVCKLLLEKLLVSCTK